MVTSKKTYNSYGITAIVSISGILLGLESASLTAFLTSPQLTEYFGTFNQWEQSIVFSSNAIGAVAGCIICGSFTDLFGCIISFQISTLFWIIGTIIVFFSPFIYLVVLGRIFKGITMGIVSSLIPVYVSEAIPTNKKGHSLSMTHLFSTLGTLSVYYVGFFFQNSIRDEYSFKYTWAIEAIPALILVTLSFFLPESPKWLASKERWVEAAKNLDRVQRSNTYKNIQRAKKDDREYVICAYTASTDFKSCSYSDLFKKKYWRYTIVGVSTQSFVQMTCAGALMYFFNYICAMCGLEDEHRIILVSMQYVVLALFTIFPIILLDGCRRKDVLTFGMFTLCAGFCSLGTVMSIFAVFIPEEIQVRNSPMNWVMYNGPASAVIAIFLFIISIFASSIVSVSWLYVGELFPGPSRSKGSSICMCASWIVNACLTLALPYSFQYLKYWTFFVISAFCFTGGAVVSTFPETRDLTELQIELLYEPNLHSAQLKSKNFRLPQALKTLKEVGSQFSVEEAKEGLQVQIIDSHQMPGQPQLAQPSKLKIDELLDERSREKRQILEKNTVQMEIQKDMFSSTASEPTKSEQGSGINNEAELFTRTSSKDEFMLPTSHHNKGEESRESSIQTVEIKKRRKEREVKTFTAGSAIDDVIDAHTAQESPSDSGISSGFEAEEYEVEEELEEDSYYSNDWFENITKEPANGLEGNASEGASIVDLKSGTTNVSVNRHELGATNFLQFDPLRISSKRFYHRQRKLDIRQQRPSSQ